MSKKNGTETTALTKNAPGFIMPDDVAALQGAMFGEGFAEEKTFGIGDPANASGKVPLYLGELVGDGGTIAVQAIGGKPDPVTGEVPMSEMPVFMFHPVDPTTLKAFTARIDNVIASHQVAAACRKYHTLAQAQGGRAQLFIRWNGMKRTRTGNQMNDISVMFRVVKPYTADATVTGEE